MFPKIKQVVGKVKEHFEDYSTRPSPIGPMSPWDLDLNERREVDRKLKKSAKKDAKSAVDKAPGAGIDPSGSESLSGGKAQPADQQYKN
jgi:hypothetical protein